MQTFSAKEITSKAAGLSKSSGLKFNFSSLSSPSPSKRENAPFRKKGLVDHGTALCPADLLRCDHNHTSLLEYTGSAAEDHRLGGRVFGDRECIAADLDLADQERVRRQGHGEE